MGTSLFESSIMRFRRYFPLAAGLLLLPYAASAQADAGANGSDSRDLREAARGAVAGLPMDRLVRGELSGDGDGIPAAMYRFEGRAGESISIRVASRDFDARLQVQRVAAQGLHAVAEDDDGALGLDAQLTTFLPATGVYLAYVTGYSAQVGDEFRIFATRGDTPPAYTTTERWVLIRSVALANVYLDRTTLTRTRAGHLRAWLDTYYAERQPHSKDGFDRDLTGEEIDCRTRRTRVFSSTLYRGGTTVSSSDRTGAWQNWKPGSLGEEMWSATCAVAEQLGL